MNMNFGKRPLTIAKLLLRNLKRTIAIPHAGGAEASIKSIRDNVSIRGSNFWILFCGAMLASLGLDVNSAAVIIGAMLVSPLMSPILGVGLGIGVNDKPLLMDSLKNFGIAVALSLLTSYIYFLITPLGVATPEILARTSPTLLDAAIAFFGGMAGMIANSRKDITNAIPGVAIATALMPPLCTSGFGLAAGDYTIFVGAFYLFFINAVIISLSTYIVCRMIKLPYVEILDGLSRKKVHRWITIFVIIVIIPSVYILYTVIREVNINQKITTFIKEKLKDDSRDALQWERVELDSLTLVKVYMVGEKLPDNKIASVSRSFDQLGLNNFRLKLIHMNMTEEERRQLTNQAAVDVLKTMEIKQNLLIRRQNEIDSIRAVQSGDSALVKEISGEIKILFPEIGDISFSRGLIAQKDTLQENIPAILVSYRRGVSIYSRTEMLSRLETYFKNRMKLDTLKVYQVY